MKYRTAYVPTVPSTVVKDGWILGRREEASNYTLDGPHLAQMCQDVCNQFDSEGYDVISINEVVRGNATLDINQSAGWSMTQGFVIAARRRS